MERQYPCLEIDLNAFRNNVREIVGRCRAAGIRTAAVIKGYDGLIPLARICREEGCSELATSRLEQIEACREAGIPGPYLLLRVPMECELSALPGLAEYSLESDWSTLEKLNEVCLSGGLTHNVVLMADLGDLREGYWDRDEFVRDCIRTERELTGLRLAGIGVNLGCYGAIEPTPEKMSELAELAARVESVIGRRLEIVSGGATTSYILVHRGIMPAGINHLRIGEAMEQPRILRTAWGLSDIGYLTEHVFTLKLQVVEVRNKPTKPVGHSVVGPFGDRTEYPDRGIRRRALAAGGKADFGMADLPIPRDAGITCIGASSDHLILDVEDCEKEVRPGDVLEFDLNYSNPIFLCDKRDVRITYA